MCLPGSYTHLHRILGIVPSGSVRPLSASVMHAPGLAVLDRCYQSPASQGEAAVGQWLVAAGQVERPLTANWHQADTVVDLTIV